MRDCLGATSCELVDSTPFVTGDAETVTAAATSVGLAPASHRRRRKCLRAEPADH